VEEIVDDFGERSPNAVILPSWTVGAIACVPGGAHPSYAHGYYKRDNAFYKAWDAISRDRDGFLAWMKANVLEQGPDAFAVHSSHTAGKSTQTAQADAGRSAQPARATDAAE
jgi:glutaconate CoA-transferase subunit A